MRWDLEIAARRVLEPIRRRMSRARAGTAGAPLVPATAGRLVELVGPSGVGKSTLVDLFLSRARGEWLCREEIAAFGDDLGDRDAGDGVHATLFKQRLATVAASDRGAWRSIRTCAYYGSIVENDLKVARGTLPRGVVLDEGLCQVFASELLTLPEADFRTAMRGRAIVLLGARDPRRVVAQTRERTRRTGRIREVHAGTSDDELARIVQRHAALLERLAARAEAAGTPLLRLAAESPLADNAAALERFARAVPARPGSRERSPAVVRIDGGLEGAGCAVSPSAASIRGSAPRR